MTKQTKKAQAGKKKSLQDFLKDTNQSKAASWADEMEDGDDLGDIPSQSDDLRAILNKSSSSSTSTGDRYTARPPRDSQFEQGAEERSSSWSRPSRGDDHHQYEPRERREPRQPTVISEDRIPNEPPFVAYIGNLPFETTKDDLADFFEANGDIVLEDIILPIDREREGRIRGHGYLVVGDRTSLVNILKFAGKNILGRDVKLDVTDEQTAIRMTTKREPRGGFDRQDRGPRGDRADRPPREQTVADLADNWRGGGKSDAPDIFGRNKRQPREDRRPRDDEEDEEGRRPRERRNELSFEEKFAMQKNRPRENRERRNDDGFGAPRPRREPTQKSGGSDLFGSGKPWEETKELRDRVEKLSESKPRVNQTESETEAPAKQQDKPFDRREKKTIDFENFQTRKSGDRGGRGGRGGGSSRGRGYSNNNNKRDAPQDKPAEKKPQEEKKPSSKSLDNAFSALEIEDVGGEE